MTRLIYILPLLLSACAAPYVNIPPVKGDVAFHSPNGKGVIAVQTAALRYVVKRWPPKGDAYNVALPDGTTQESYRLVVGKLPEGVATPDQIGQPLPTYRVEQIHIEGPDARVDITLPGPDGRDRLVSVFEAIDMGGWYARRSKLWNIPVEEALKIIRSTPQAAEPAEAPPEKPADHAAPAEK